MLTVKNLKLSVSNENSEKKILFENLSFEAKSGEISMITGKNGCGKSTLLKTLMGVHQKEEGALFLNHTDLDTLSTKERSKRISCVRQDPEMGTLKDFSVLENFCFTLNKEKSLGLWRSAVSEKRTLKIKDFISTYSPQFLEKLDQKVSSLSGGQRQLLSILMNIASDSEVLLLDEPTAALDSTATESIMTQLRSLVREKNLIAIMVCHDSSIVKQYADARINVET